MRRGFEISAPPFHIFHLFHLFHARATSETWIRFHFLWAMAQSHSQNWRSLVGQLRPSVVLSRDDILGHTITTVGVRYAFTRIVCSAHAIGRARSDLGILRQDTSRKANLLT